MAEPLQDPGTPEELEFEDDDGTMYRWDPLLRKYMPTGDAAATAHEAEQQTDAAAQQPAQQQSEPHEQQQQQQQQQQEQQEYDLEAMTYEAQEEVVPTLAAVRAAEEAALAGASGAPGGPQQRAGGKVRAHASCGGSGVCGAGGRGACVPVCACATPPPRADACRHLGRR
jgi:HIV Tat-specific factor 1